jgi:hypothetical protein
LNLALCIFCFCASSQNSIQYWLHVGIYLNVSKVLIKYTYQSVILCKTLLLKWHFAGRIVIRSPYQHVSHTWNFPQSGWPVKTGRPPRSVLRLGAGAVAAANYQLSTRTCCTGGCASELPVQVLAVLSVETGAFPVADSALRRGSVTARLGAGALMPLVGFQYSFGAIRYTKI